MTATAERVRRPAALIGPGSIVKIGGRWCRLARVQPNRMTRNSVWWTCAIDDTQQDKRQFIISWDLTLWVRPEGQTHE